MKVPSYDVFIIYDLMVMLMRLSRKRKCEWHIVRHDLTIPIYDGFIMLFHAVLFMHCELSRKQAISSYSRPIGSVHFHGVCHHIIVSWRPARVGSGEVQNAYRRTQQTQQSAVRQ
jgi:hypothetical protein